MNRPKDHGSTDKHHAKAVIAVNTQMPFYAYFGVYTDIKPGQIDSISLLPWLLNNIYLNNASELKGHKGYLQVTQLLRPPRKRLIVTLSIMD